MGPLAVRLIDAVAASGALCLYLLFDIFQEFQDADSFFVTRGAKVM